MIASALDGAVWRVTLARPEKRNALTVAMMDELCARLERPPDGARALVLEGEGRAFCSGFDLDACRADPRGTLGALVRGLSAAVAAMRALPMGVVVCAHGAAVAGGCALLGGADVVVTDRGAKLGYPVVKMGISPAVSVPFLLAGVGAGAARALTLDPGLITGERAHAIGLADVLTEDAEGARGSARAAARTLADKPGGAVAATRAWIAEIEGDLGVAAGVGASVGVLDDPELMDRLGRAWSAR